MCRAANRGGWVPPASSSPVRPTSTAHPDMAFRGYYDNTLDAKNRLTIPAKLRKALDDGVVVALQRDAPECVAIWCPERLRGLRQRAARGDRPPLSSDYGSIERFSNAWSQELELDAAGRVMVPAKMLEQAGLRQGGRGDRRRQPPGDLGPRGVGADERCRLSAPSSRSDRDRRVATLLDMTVTHVPVLAGELIELLDPAARRDRGRLHRRRRRPRAADRRADRLERHADRDRSRPDRAGALRGALARGQLRHPLHPRDLRARASRCCSTRALKPTACTSTSAPPRCRSTPGSAASPTPTTRRSTCAWIPTRS